MFHVELKCTIYFYFLKRIQGIFCNCLEHFARLVDPDLLKCVHAFAGKIIYGNNKKL